MEQDTSDHNAARGPFWPAMRDLGDVARSWNNPFDLLTKLKRLMIARPLLGLFAAVSLGALLHKRR